MQQWFVYVLVSDSLGVTYVGLSTAVERRLEQHNGELRGGASSTRRGRPWRVGAVCAPVRSRSAALKLEYEIKRHRGLDRIAAANAHTKAPRKAPRKTPTKSR